jgi:hypothetical protein
MLLCMTREASKLDADVMPTEREELLEAMLVEEPELRFTPRGDPDPRLVRLVDFLARQAAREFFEQENTRQSARGS